MQNMQNICKKICILKIWNQKLQNMHKIYYIYMPVHSLLCWWSPSLQSTGRHQSASLLVSNAEATGKTAVAMVSRRRAGQVQIMIQAAAAWVAGGPFRATYAAPGD